MNKNGPNKKSSRQLFSIPLSTLSPPPPLLHHHTYLKTFTHASLCTFAFQNYCLPFNIKEMKTLHARSLFLKEISPFFPLFFIPMIETDDAATSQRSSPSSLWRFFSEREENSRVVTTLEKTFSAIVSIGGCRI